MKFHAYWIWNYLWNLPDFCFSGTHLLYVLWCLPAFCFRNMMIVWWSRPTPNSSMAMSTWETLVDLSSLHWLTAATWHLLQPCTCTVVGAPKALQAQGKQKQPKIWENLWACMSLLSTAQKVWITNPWVACSQDWLRLAVSFFTAMLICLLLFLLKSDNLFICTDLSASYSCLSWQQCFPFLIYLLFYDCWKN